MAISPYSFGLAARNTPQLYTGYFTLQGGITNTRYGSVTGAGFVPPNMPVGTFRPFVQTYQTRIADPTGAGIVIAHPLNVSRLLEPPGSRASIG